jgi:uncharacterized protein DUF397
MMNWRKSKASFSNGNCVEVGDCTDGDVAVRNSRDPSGVILRFSPEEWHEFLYGVRTGVFDAFGRPN